MKKEDALRNENAESPVEDLADPAGKREICDSARPFCPNLTEPLWKTILGFLAAAAIWLLWYCLGP